MTPDHDLSETRNSSSLEPKMGGGQERRLHFIDFRLRWEGKLNRTDLTEQFGVSTPQASLDISKYKLLAPGNLDYDASSKTYLATSAFRAFYSLNSAKRFLAENLAVEAGLLGRDASFIGTPPPLDAVPSPWRTFDDQTVDSVVRAIRKKLSLRVNYQSMSSPEPSWRTLSPHALGYDGFRWHVRAFCHKRERFGDFVLARLLNTEELGFTEVDFELDSGWHTKLTLILEPHPQLTAAQKRVVELDYSMKNGEARFECRQALLFYTLRRLNLREQDELRMSSIELQVVLKNREALQKYILEVQST
ncbi:WYL domain-containing protein [Comamonas sp. 26]|uniref:WYL domain-containing protein n=1 Tax=Comamonas sp. 26 TaxID=2035201 RepID=UPI000C174D19|nr:WYL domain-containing protein [Comamonas sp. 26]PIG08296.1 WYL domain-containing protein [Comamonas sp. 26]